MIRFGYKMNRHEMYFLDDTNALKKHIEKIVNNEVSDADIEIILADRPAGLFFEKNGGEKAEYQILGVEAAGLPCLGVKIYPKEGVSPEESENWFREQKYTFGLNRILQEKIPLNLMWEIHYYVRNKEEWTELKHVVLGSFRLGYGLFKERDDDK